MFGYVIPYKSELKMKEYNMFRAYYCGLCKAMGKEANQMVRMGLNYDLTFMGLLLSSIQEDRSQITFEGCIANPFKKKPIVQMNNALKYTSNISTMLIYFKLIDDWNDEKSITSLLGTVPFINSVKKSSRKYPSQYNDIKKYLKELSKLENNKCNKVDEAADMFGKLMESISTPDFITDEKIIRTLKWLGYNLGRWIYILDAFNDIEEDIKKKNYNPIILQYKYKENESINDFLNRIKEPIEFSLTFTLENMSRSFELLDVKYNRSILENIIYMGTRYKMDNIINQKEEEQIEKSLRSIKH
ncbi:hypothetical protein CLPU_1c01330 [Gottschalkia purinilytica]|uniref:Uncharacterized protein n=1 Tax=Gottschalkia purinilytica TaxID=1503 RepID=A0A0L0WES1_GOTPU|nr:DUF5685 family protein [Gottschalkia purinilytica]KNF09968.1 hypothetical protein CLPU_1c01330 [Gottschalkia purinilytica]